MKNRLILLLFGLSVTFFAQPGKDGPLTVSTASRVLNRYCPVLANIATNTNTFVITTPTLVSLCPGDLIMVYQAQGANINSTATSTLQYGTVTAYNSAGLFEFKYVQSINGNTVTTQTTFTNSYQAAGKVQVIKVPQYTTLTINTGASITSRAWKDTTVASVDYRLGGLVVIHASTIINNGTINNSGKGFRGGTIHYDPAVPLTGISLAASTDSANGGEKGESIFGAAADYDLITGRYCMGAPANGGGGGNSHNAGGGGGANGNNGNTWTGEGVMFVDVNNPLAAWSLSSWYVANGTLANSSGGGHGGYSWGNLNVNALSDAPGSTAWLGDNRREVGGVGGRPLTNINPETRIYFGGGGGAPEANNNASASGSNGGGIVYLIATTGISGTGTISTDGINASNTAVVCSCDGAPGAGAGGSIVIKTTALANTQLVSANGGNGGTQLALNSPGNSTDESEGPGGGGGGGFVALPAGSAAFSIAGGLNGITYSGAVTEMTSNGTTRGASGQTIASTPAFITYTTIPVTNTANICANASFNFTANTSASYNWGGPDGFTSAIQNPTLTGALSSQSGLYTVTLTIAGCPGTSGQSYSVTVNPTPTISVSSVSICYGANAILTANGATTYTWDNGAYTGNPYNPTPATTTQYTVIGTSATGCTASATASVTVYQLPVLSFASSPVSCSAPGTATITATGGTGPYSYTWSPGAQTGSAVTNIYPGFYTTSVFDTGTGCYTIATKNFTPSVAFTGVIASNSLVCNGVASATANISMSGGSGTQTYAWTNPPGLQTTPMANNLTAGLHTVTVTDGMSACTFTQTFSITQPPPLVLTLTASSPTACTGSIIGLTALSSGGTAGYSYSWTPGPATNTNTAAYTSAGTYSYSVISTDANNCTTTKTISVAFITTPTVTASSATICQNAVATLTASGATTYVWYAGGTPGTTFTTNPGTSSTYTVVGNSSGCFASASAVVMVKPLPVISVVIPLTICAENALTISGFGNGTYAWSGPAGFTSTQQNPVINSVVLSNSGIYVLTVTAVNGCVASASGQVAVLPNPALVAGGTTVCIGEPAVLTASGSGTFAWSGPNGFSSQLANPVIPLVNASGSYTVVVTGANSCTSYSVVQLLANPFPLPTPTINTNPAGCFNSKVVLHGLGGVSYLWQGPKGFTSSAQDAGFIANSLNFNGVYTLTVKDANNCHGSNTVTINIYPQPKGQLLSPATNFCVPASADFNFKQALTNIAPVNSSTIQIYDKSFTDSTAHYYFTTPGTYTVNVIFKDTNACSNSAYILVNAHDKPTADFDFFPTNPMVSLDRVLFTNASSGANQTSWTWFFKDEVADSVSTKNTHHVFQNTGDYAVAMVVKNKWGCTDTVVKVLSVGEEFSLYVPNAFTPNSDNINDVFQPKGLSIQDYRLQLFDRWGQLMFESTDFYTGWNGRFKGDECPNDTYVWKIDVVLNGGRSKTFTGNVSLIR